MFERPISSTSSYGTPYRHHPHQCSIGISRSRRVRVGPRAGVYSGLLRSALHPFDADGIPSFLLALFEDAVHAKDCIPCNDTTNGRPPHPREQQIPKITQVCPMAHDLSWVGVKCIRGRREYLVVDGDDNDRAGLYRDYRDYQCQ